MEDFSFDQEAVCFQAHKFSHTLIVHMLLCKARVLLMLYAVSKNLFTQNVTTNIKPGTGPKYFRAHQ